MSDVIGGAALGGALDVPPVDASEWPGFSTMASAGFVAAVMAWAIGAQDVSNCFGTAVGSRALTIPQALIIAALCEFAGSLTGGSVAATLTSGILDMDALSAMGPAGVSLYVQCMLSTMAGAVAWLIIATVYSLPVSTTHSLVGALVGVGVLATGRAKWTSLGGVGEWSERGDVTGSMARGCSVLMGDITRIGGPHRVCDILPSAL
jgi:inorganic phosphate transporter, PiT family